MDHDSPSPSKLPVASKGTPIKSVLPVPSGDSKPVLFFTMSALEATIASRMLPHIDARADAFLCMFAILLNMSAAISTVALTALGVQLDFRLSRLHGLARIPKLLYLNWLACTLGGIACLITALAPYGTATFTWTREILT